MSRPDRTVEMWRREVFRSSVLSDRTKVLLLWMADRMRTDRQVSIPRERMAAALGKSERRITERITEAHNAGFLDTITSGRKGVTAVYQGMFPNAVSGTDVRPLTSALSGTRSSPLRSAETRPLNDPKTALRGRPCVPPVVERTSPQVPTDRNDGSNEKAADHQVRASLPPCDHGMPGGDRPDRWLGGRLSCPLCALTSSREEEAS